MKTSSFGLLIAVTATQTTAQTDPQGLAVNAIPVPTYFPTENSDDNYVNPSVIGGTVLDRDDWEQSRRYLVDIKGDDNGFHTCGATKVSDRVVLTAARELIQYE